MRAEEIEDGEKGMCPVIRSATLHCESTDVYITSKVDRRLLRRTTDCVSRGERKGRGGDVSDIRSETLHSETMDVFTVSEADRRPLTQSPYHAETYEAGEGMARCFLLSDRRRSTRSSRTPANEADRVL